MDTFWDRVASELDYLGMTNKALAEKVGITASNIGKGKKQGSCPAADTALKIARVLNVSVEYLVTGNDSDKAAAPGEREQMQLHKYRKYHELIEKCEQLSADKVRLLAQIADNLEKS